jgi:hypothetical protein
MVYYKIRHKNRPEMFRKSDGSWNGSGKVYDTLGKLRTLLTTKINSYSEHSRREIADWEIVEYEVTVKAVKGIHEVITPQRMMDYIKNI